MAWAKSALMTRESNVSSPRRVRSPTAFRPSKCSFFNRFIQAKIDTHVCGDLGHLLADSSTTTGWMKHAIFIFKERQNRKQTGALKRRHPQVLGLEGKGGDESRVREVATEVIGHGSPWAHPWRCLQHSRSQQVEHTVERRFQNRPEPFQLRSILIHEPNERISILWRNPRNLSTHPVQVRSRINAPPPHRTRDGTEDPGGSSELPATDSDQQPERSLRELADTERRLARCRI